MSIETRTITEMVAADPDVDQTEVWQRFWDILTGVRDRLLDRFDVALHPSCADHEAYTAGDFEGSLQTYTGEEVEWLVHSWIGNRKRSILDMNINVWLGPHIDVPHLVFVYGTVPKLYHYSDLIARRDLADDPDYLQRCYEPENPHFLSFRADERFHWSVSHGTYMRAILSPVGFSFMAERTEEVLEEFEQRLHDRLERWLALVDAAEPVPESDRPALQARDHRLRRRTYTLDPMNELATSFMGADTVERMVALRAGLQQMQEQAPLREQAQLREPAPLREQA